MIKLKELGEINHVSPLKRVEKICDSIDWLSMFQVDEWHLHLKNFSGLQCRVHYRSRIVNLGRLVR